MIIKGIESDSPSIKMFEVGHDRVTYMCRLWLNETGKIVDANVVELMSGEELEECQLREDILSSLEYLLD